MQPHAATKTYINMPSSSEGHAACGSEAGRGEASCGGAGTATGACASHRPAGVTRSQRGCGPSVAPKRDTLQPRGRLVNCPSS